MLKKYINADLLKEKLNGFTDCHIDRTSISREYECGYDDCLTAVQDAISDIIVTENSNMEKITFEQFINIFNFRFFNEQIYTEKDKYDTKPVRFYFGERDDEWFEYGLYDFGGNAWNIAQKTLSKAICKSHIDIMTYDDDLGILKVYLELPENCDKEK